MKKYCVICVDDEPLSVKVLKNLCEQIEEIGEINIFTSSLDALSFAKKNSIDIAFLDVDMPSMDGILLASNLRELYPKINIIMTTAYAQYAVEALSLDCSGYLMKPISLDSLKHQLEVLRFPLQEEVPHTIEIHCFGNFEILCDGYAVRFAHFKTLELLAYLVDRNGARCTNAQILATLWDDDKNHNEYLKIIKRDLIGTFSDLGIDDLVKTARGQIRLHKELVKCDYFDYIDNKNLDLFKGEYMEQYSWAEERKAFMIFGS